NLSLNRLSAARLTRSLLARREHFSVPPSSLFFWLRLTAAPRSRSYSRRAARSALTLPSSRQSCARGGRNDPDFHFGFDLGMQLDLDRVHRQFLEGPFQPHRVGGNVETGVLERLADVGRPDRAVQMPLFVRVRFDRHAVLA